MSKVIVVIEDDEYLMYMIRYILNEEGYIVEEFQKIPTIEQVRALQPHLVLTDLKLPNGNGNEFCKDLKNSPLTKHIPVIVVSATDDVANIAFQYKADAFIAKPFDLTSFMTVVNDAVAAY